MMDGISKAYMAKKLNIEAKADDLALMTPDTFRKFVVRLLLERAGFMYRPSAYTKCPDCDNMATYGHYCDDCWNLWTEAVYNVNNRLLTEELPRKDDLND